MIRTLRALVARTDLRRLVGLLVVLAVVVVLVHAAAHVGGSSDGHHLHDCAICATAACTYAIPTIAAPQFDFDIVETERLAPACTALPRGVEPGCLHAPRGPPSAA